MIKGFDRSVMLTYKDSQFTFATGSQTYFYKWPVTKIDHIKHHLGKEVTKKIIAHYKTLISWKEVNFCTPLGCAEHAYPND